MLTLNSKTMDLYSALSFISSLAGRLVIFLTIFLTSGPIGSIASSSNPNANSYMESFFMSARVGDIPKLLEYIQNGVDVSSRDLKGNTALIIASGRGQVQAIKQLLSYGANPEDSTIGGLFDGKTCLMWASSQGRIEAVEALLLAGANVNRVTDRGVFLGKNALCWASSQGRTQVVHLLLRNGADTDYSSPTGNFRGKTALMWSSSQGRLESVAALLAAGAKVNKGDHDGVTALMWASGSEVSGDGEHKKGLLEKANKGDTLAEVVNLLISYGASIDARDKDGITSIMYASFHGHDNVVTALLRAGADTTFKNKAGRTALQLAYDGGHSHAAQIINDGVDIVNLPIQELLKIPTCGWLLSVLRSYSRHRLQYKPFGDDNYSVARSCAHLNTHGLDGTVGELLEVAQGSSPEEVVSLLGELNFASIVRATNQLKLMLSRYSAVYPSQIKNHEGSPSVSGNSTAVRSDGLCCSNGMDSIDRDRLLIEEIRTMLASSKTEVLGFIKELLVKGN